MMSIKKINKENIVAHLQIDVPSKNIVDKDVQSMLLPFSLMQITLLGPKFRIKNNIITRNDILYKFILVCGTLMTMFEYFYRVLRNSDPQVRKYVFLPIQDVGTYTDFSFNFSGFLMIFLINLVHSKSYVMFILTIQEVHRFVNDKVNFKRLIKSNWISIILLFSCFIVFIIYIYAMYPDLEFHVFMNMVVLIVFDADMIHAISFMKLLECEVVQWNNKVLSFYNDHQNETYSKKLLEVYPQIIKSYNIYKNIFQYMVVHYTLNNFLHTLVYVEVLIQYFQKSTKPEELFIAMSSSILICTWLSKNLVLQIILILKCEAFYKAVENSHDTCTLILMSNYTDDVKKLCKNVRRVYRASFNKMRACRLFYVDVCLLLHLAALISNYSIVLLQFAFL